MKLLVVVLTCLFLASCSKADIKPAGSQRTNNAVAADTLINDRSLSQANTPADYDWYNGTTGTAIIQVTCADCNAIATIGNVTIPFLLNQQGIGQLKYTPSSGLLIHIAVCPGDIKQITADVLDATNTPLFSYSGLSGNWSATYVIK